MYHGPMTNEVAEEYLASASDETLDLFAAWIRLAGERFYVLDCERRILTILSDDLLHRRWQPPKPSDKQEPCGPVSVPRPERAVAYCCHGQPLNGPCEGCTGEIARRMNEEGLAGFIQRNGMET